MPAVSESAILVTGATGFIGRHVVRRLLLDRNRLVLLARSHAGVSAKERVAKRFGNLTKRIDLLEGDLAYSSILKENVSRLRSKVHTVIHCAGDTCFSDGRDRLEPNRSD